MSRTRGKAVPGAGALLALGMLAAPEVACAEWAFGAYGGAASTANCDVTLSRPGGTRLTFRDVSWDDESFDSPIFYGARLVSWLGGDAAWGVSLDFTHAKIVAERGRAVAVSGTRNGAPVEGTELLADTFDELQVSHGLNFLTVNALRRWRPGDAAGQDAFGRLRPFATLGGGIVIPHVEVQTAGSATGEYHVTGPALQGGGGTEVLLTGPLSLWGEYRLSYADVWADLAGGGSIELNPWTHHLMLGLVTAF